MSNTLDKQAVIDAMDRCWRAMVEFPFARMCKHYAAGIVVSEMEKLGINPPEKVITAIVQCRDEDALGWVRGEE